MTEPGDGLSLEEITAALRADSADVALYARVLTESLGDALPAGCVVVDRDRTMSDRMRGRPGQVTKVTVRLGEKVLTLAVQPGRPHHGRPGPAISPRASATSRRRPLPPARRDAGMGGRTGKGTGRSRTAERTRGRGVAQARRRFLGHHPAAAMADPGGIRKGAP